MGCRALKDDVFLFFCEKRYFTAILYCSSNIIRRKNKDADL